MDRRSRGQCIAVLAPTTLLRWTGNRSWNTGHGRTCTRQSRWRWEVCQRHTGCHRTALSKQRLRTELKVSAVSLPGWRKPGIATSPSLCTNLFPLSKWLLYFLVHLWHSFLFVYTRFRAVKNIRLFDFAEVLDRRLSYDLWDHENEWTVTGSFRIQENIRIYE